MKKFEYAFERIDLRGFFSGNPKEDYKKMIEDRGKEGWQLVQIFPPVVKGNGAPLYYEMIFIRELA